MSGQTSEFAGFPEEAFGFLSELSLNNDRAWFKAHRGVYETAVVQPALAFISSMGGVIREFAPSVVADARVGGSLFRVQRDTRFSADKRPYKTHVGIRFRDADTAVSAKCTGPLFYVEFDAASLRLGVGVKEFDSQTLSVFRDVVSGEFGNRDILQSLDDAAAAAQSEGADVLGQVLSRAPRGFSDDEASLHIRRKGFFIMRNVPLPPEIKSREFPRYCGRWFETYAPLFHALRGVAMKGLEAA